jgi:uncharacterized protein YoaH (UPF0181 family)
MKHSDISKFYTRRVRETTKAIRRELVLLHASSFSSVSPTQMRLASGVSVGEASLLVIQLVRLHHAEGRAQASPSTSAFRPQVAKKLAIPEGKLPSQNSVSDTVEYRAIYSHGIRQSICGRWKVHPPCRAYHVHGPGLLHRRLVLFRLVRIRINKQIARDQNLLIPATPNDMLSENMIEIHVS